MIRTPLRLCVLAVGFHREGREGLRKSLTERARPAVSLYRVGSFVSFCLASAATAASAQSTVARIDALMQAYADQGKFSGSVLVANHGAVIYRKGFGWANAEWKIPNGPNTKFRIGRSPSSLPRCW